MKWEPSDETQKGIWWAVIATILVFELVVVAGYLVQKSGYLGRPPVQSTDQRRQAYENSDGKNFPGGGQASSACNNDSANQQQECTERTDSQQQSGSVFASDEASLFDLSAQEGMWRATNALAYLTVAQSVIGVFGLAFIVWTLMTQQNELREARNVTKSQRAFVLSGLPPQRFTVGNAYVIRTTFINKGQTPAFNLTIKRGYKIVNPDDPVPEVTINTAGKMQPFHIGAEQIANADIVINKMGIADAVEGGNKHVIMGFAIYYRDVFGGENELKEFAFRYHLQSVQKTSMGEVRLMANTPISPRFRYENQGEEYYEITAPAIALT